MQMNALWKNTLAALAKLKNAKSSMTGRQKDPVDLRLLPSRMDPPLTMSWLNEITLWVMEPKSRVKKVKESKAVFYSYLFDMFSP